MRLLRAVLVAAVLTSAATPPATGAPEDAPAVHAFDVLVFSKTAGFRHNSIADGVEMFEALAAEHGFTVEATEDAAVFTDSLLARYAAVVFLNTTGDVLNADQQAAFERFVQGGGGYLGLHAASDTEYNWPWYGRLVGAYFASHPPGTHAAVVHVADPAHPSTVDLPRRWERTDEWYDFRANPRGTVHVLATLDEDTYQGGGMGADHPIAWCQSFEGGRSWYTAGGHTPESYREPLFRAHVLGGLLYVVGEVEGECGAGLGRNFDQEVLEEGLDNPMDLAVAPDGRVFYVELGGRVRVWDPATNRTTTAATLSVTATNENGLLGIELDPGFADNAWVYLFYSPADGTPRQRLARFTVRGGTLDRDSERVMLEFPAVHATCCHAAGSMAFDADGNLYLSTGDDTNPFDSDGYAPIDERPGRTVYDAQRSSANTHDLRGKILRVTPQPDGTYTIPDGNLFDAAEAGRPEVYVMGVRNPFRIAVDQQTGWLYWGDVGPDAVRDDPRRGPTGLDEWNQARSAGNYGWPYCLGPNRPYVDYDFATGAAAGTFDCDAPVNDSPNNTGRRALPPARPAWIWYPYGASDAFPGIPAGANRTAMAGPTYHYDAAGAAEDALPRYYDGAVFLYEWTRSWILAARLDESGGVASLEPFLPHLPLRRPMAMEVGPEGRLYLLEWGTGFTGNNPDSRLSRLVFRPGSRAPVIALDAAPTSGPVPLTVRFSAAGSYDPDPGDLLTYAWDFDGDGTVDADGEEVTHTYTVPGRYEARLTLRDTAGKVAEAGVEITVGNAQPVVTIEAPADGAFFGWGDVIPFRVHVRDAEDGDTTEGTIPCTSVSVQPLLGHDDHGHPLDRFETCEGTFQVESGHGQAEDELFYVLEAAYTDAGAPGVDPLRGVAQVRLFPRTLEAELAPIQEGTVVAAPAADGSAPGHVGYIDHGDYVAFEGLDLSGIDYVTFRVASAGAGGRIGIHAGGSNGRRLGVAYVDPTGGWFDFEDVTAALTPVDGREDLYLVFTNEPGATGLFNVDHVLFHGPSAAGPDPEGPDGFAATYFANTDLSGRSATRLEPRVNFNWGQEAPLPFYRYERFSARWSARLTVPASGTYMFAVKSTGGARLWVADHLVLDRWQDRQSAATFNSFPLRLTEGERLPLRLEYFNGGGPAQVHLLWTGPSVDPGPVPADAVRPDTLTTTNSEPLGGPGVFALAPVYPNPVKGHAVLTYSLPAPDAVHLAVYDVLGRRVSVLADGHRAAGTHTVEWPVDGLAGGLYLCRLKTPHGTRVQRVVVVGGR